MSHHGHHHHHHHHGDDVSDRRIIWTVLLNLLLTVVEVVVGILSGSLALIADAVHNFSDAGALVIALVARRIGRRAPDEAFTFGYRRAELIGAIINLTVLMVVGLYLIYESVMRFFQPTEIEALWVILAASAAVIVDLLTVVLLWAMARGNINIRAAFLHNLVDAAVSLAVIAGAAIIHWFGWHWIDAVLTLIIAAYILVMSTGMLRRSAAILMEGTPPGLDLELVRKTTRAHPDVADLHHLHAWQLDEEHRALEAHVVLCHDLTLSQVRAVTDELKAILRDDFHISHATLEMEYDKARCKQPTHHH